MPVRRVVGAGTKAEKAAAVVEAIELGECVFIKEETSDFSDTVTCMAIEELRQQRKMYTFGTDRGIWYFAWDIPMDDYFGPPPGSEHVKQYARTCTMAYDADRAEWWEANDSSNNNVVLLCDENLHTAADCQWIYHSLHDCPDDIDDKCLFSSGLTVKSTGKK